MRAIVIKQYGGPDVLQIEDRPDPQPEPGSVVIQVKAFGLNQAEVHFRKGAWGEVAEITGIECVGLIVADSGGRFAAGQKVMALVGGMGRGINGSYAELVRVPSSNVVAVQSDLTWEELAAIPESYATAWTSLVSILQLQGHQTVLIRGATSALGLAAVNIGVEIGARVMATTRQPSRAAMLKALGAQEVFIEAPQLHELVRDCNPHGIDAVLDIVGNSTVMDSLAALRRGGRACVVGFLGRGGPLTLEPVFQIPSGTFLSAFASALVTGTPEFPLSQIPFDTIVGRVAAGIYKAKPAKVFPFERIQDAHRFMEANEVAGKVVVAL